MEALEDQYVAACRRLARAQRTRQVAKGNLEAASDALSNAAREENDAADVVQSIHEKIVDREARITDV